MTDWLSETITELQYREQQYRNRTDDPEYWSNVANGLSEALDVLEEVDRKRTAEELENNE